MMSSDVVWSFGYGSNMSTASLRWKGIQIEEGKSRAVVLRGFRMFFNAGGGMANVYPDAEHAVYGVCHLMKREQKQKLDKAEGGGMYYKTRKVLCEPLDGSDPLEAEVFCMDHAPEDTGLPSERYRTILVEGAMEFNLPAEWIEMLQAQKTEPERPISDWTTLPLGPDIVYSPNDILQKFPSTELVFIFFGRVVRANRVRAEVFSLCCVVVPP